MALVWVASGYGQTVAPLAPLPPRRTHASSAPRPLPKVRHPLDLLGDRIESLVDMISEMDPRPDEYQYVTESYTAFQVGILNPQVDPRQDEIVVMITGYNASTPEYLADTNSTRSYRRSKRPIYFIDPNVDPKPPAETAYDLGIVLQKILEVSGAKRCVLICHSKAGIDFRALVTNRAKKSYLTFDYPNSTLFERIVGVAFLAVPHQGVNMFELFDGLRDVYEESHLEELESPRAYLSNQAIDALFSPTDPYPGHLYMLNVIGTRPYSPIEMDEILPLPPKNSGEPRSWLNGPWYSLYGRLGYLDSDGVVRVDEARFQLANRETKVWTQHDQFFNLASPVMAYVEEAFQRSAIAPVRPATQAGAYVPRKPR